MQTEMEIISQLHSLIEAAIILVGIWGFVKVLMEIVTKINNRHDKEQRWDNYEKNLREERDKIYTKYDTKLSELETRMEDNHIETEAKLQQTQSELFILTQCMSAVLDGLKQMNCNGKVTEAQLLLDEYLNKRAHGQEDIL